MSNYTPGPWRHEPHQASHGDKIAVVDAIGRILALIPGHKATDKANAQLIAAAPELLEALQYAREELAMRIEEDGGTEYSVAKGCRILDAAIAKATGKL